MKVVIDKGYIEKSGWIKSIPHIFDKQGSVVYQARNTLKKLTSDGEDFVVKRYAVPLFFNRIAYTFFRESKAKRAYENALRLLKEEINTPTPVAYIEKRCLGLLHRAYFVSVADSSPYLMRQYVDYVNEGEEILRQFATFTKLMHDKGILHLDYSPGNILFSIDKEGNARFSIIDLNRMRFDEPIIKEERLMSFRRMARSEAVLEIIAGEYALLCGWNREETVRDVISYSKEFWRKTDKKIALKGKLKKAKG